MVILVSVGVETLKLVAVFIALSTKEKVVTVLAHPTIRVDATSAPKAFILLMMLNLGLKNDFHRMLSTVSSMAVYAETLWSLKIAFLTLISIGVHKW